MKLFSKKKETPVPPPIPRSTASEKPKTETILKLDLPDVFAFQEDATKAKTAARIAPDTVADTNGLTTRGTVVLVESDDEARRLMSRLLQYEGYTLHTVSCLAEAREMLKATPATFVLARRACVPLNLQTEIALREVRKQTSVRIVDEFSDLILGQVVDYESLAECSQTLTGLLLSLLEGANTGARGHSHTVAKYCRLVGQRLGMRRRDLDGLTLAAELHDLGWLETERRISEPVISAKDFQPPALQPPLDLLANVKFPNEINDQLAATSDAGHGTADAEATGLPPVPLGARILRVVDTYDTLRRRQAEQFPTEDKLLEWMRRQPTGTFDSDALETLIHIRKHESAINAMNLFNATVLFVDPHPEELGLLRLRLENDDYQVLTARSVTEALQHLRAQNIALVLTEYTLNANENGFDLLRAIKDDPSLRHIPVILHAAPDTDRTRQALEWGAEDWYPKPVNVEIAALKTIRILGRVRAPASTAQGVQGNLRDLGIVEMVQILCGGGRSVQLVLQNASHRAELAIFGGRVVSANLGHLTGEPAALEILSWHDGNFALRPLRESPPANITISTDNLLLQACLAADHRNAEPPTTGISAP